MKRTAVHLKKKTLNVPNFERKTFARVTSDLFLLHLFFLKDVQCTFTFLLKVEETLISVLEIYSIPERLCQVYL